MSSTAEAVPNGAMLKVILAVVFLLCGARASAQQPPPIGVNLNNLWQVGTLEQEYAMIDRAYEAGARLVRLSLGTEDAPIAASKSHMAYCALIGMDVSLTINMSNANFYPSGTLPVPSDRWGNRYRLSDLDVNLFDNWIQGLLHDLNTAGVTPRYIQLFNEIGWIDFNGDLPEVSNGKVFTYATNWSDTQYVQIRAGLSKYGQALQRLRTACGNEFGAGKVRLSVSGLNFWGDTVGNYASAIFPDLVVDLLQGTHPNQNGAPNYLQYADEIALHPQPNTDASLSDLNSLYYIYNDIKPKVKRIKDVLSNPLMPIRFSEWFLRTTDFDGLTSPEWERLRHHHMVLKSMTRMTDTMGVNWEGSTYYTFVRPEHSNNLYDLATDTVLRSADVLQETPYNVLRNGDFEGDLAYWTIGSGTAGIYTNSTLGKTCGLTPAATTIVYQDFNHVQAGDLLQLKGKARLANAADTASLYAWVQDANGNTLLSQQLVINTTSYEQYATRPFVAPAGAHHVRVRMYRPAGQGNCYFDGIQLLVHPNLVMNNDYADGLAYWTSINNSASVITGFGDWNQNVLSIQGGQALSGAYQKITNLVAGKNYRFLAWARATAQGGAPAFEIKFENASNQVLSSETIPIDSTSYKYYISANITAPAQADHAYIYITQGNTTGSIYVRDASLYLYRQP